MNKPQTHTVYETFEELGPNYMGSQLANPKWVEIIGEKGGDIMWEHTAKQLVQDADGKVTGIIVQAKDGKYILDLSAEQAGGDRLIICQSNADTENLRKMFPAAVINPLGDWTGGSDVDCGAINRKLGSDMGDSVTGGGLHGKDLSKADVSVNIYAFLEAQALGRPVEISCAIGDDTVDGKPYADIVEIARKYIHDLGGFEKFAEWGLIR